MSLVAGKTWNVGETLVVDLSELHERLRAIAPLNALARIAVAIYDAKTDVLHTFIQSNDGEPPLSNYVAKLSDVSSLVEIAKSGAPRVVDDLCVFGAGSEHSRQLVGHGYRSSYTVPLIRNGQLRGFLFFNAMEKAFFTPMVIAQLWPYAQIAVLSTLIELDKIQVLQAAISTLRQISRQRDEETGAHLQRMSRYARMIAEALAQTHHLDDEYIEFLFHFSTLHDVGKVAIPDSILLKPGRLDPQELAAMRMHVEKGRQIVDSMVAEFDMGELAHIDILLNIVSYHHENWDGSGYPFGLSGDAIPLEARITAVADVFDALTNTRPYKRAWSNEDAFAYLMQMRGIKFYPPAVDAFLARRTDIALVQQQFRETPFD